MPCLYTSRLATGQMCYQSVVLVAFPIWDYESVDSVEGNCVDNLAHGSVKMGVAHGSLKTVVCYSTLSVFGRLLRKLVR
jgi:hypothetical protein